MKHMTDQSSIQWTAPIAKYVGGPLILFHTGLGPGDTFQHEKGRPLWYIEKLQKIALEMQKQFLSKNNLSAVDMSQSCVAVLEKDPLFNAGFGSKLQRDGKARLSSSIMNGQEQKAAGVSNLQLFSHPSKLAQNLLDQKDRFLGGPEATYFALSQGMTPESPISEHRLTEWRERKHGETGTVGSVVLDGNHQTAACTSTGGIGFETPGRASDSFTVAGNYASSFGAVSCTGAGGDIIDAALAASIVCRLEDQMSLQEAVSRAFLRHSKRKFGMVGLDRKGHIIAHATNGTLGFGVVHKNFISVGLTYSDWSTFADDEPTSS